MPDTPSYEPPPPSEPGAEGGSNPAVVGMRVQPNARAPQRVRRVQRNLDMAYLGERLILPCPDLDTATLQLQRITTTTTYCTFTIRVRNNGENWVNHPSTVTAAADGITAAFTVTGYDEVCAEITSVTGPAVGRTMVTLNGRSTT
jgi:hypothetical protein